MKKISGLVFLGFLVSGGVAHAEGLWTPLDTKVKANMFVGFDHSVTMGITPNCGSCHGPGHPSTRLEQAKGDIIATMDVFRDYFLFGGFTYSGCGFAKIDGRVLPDPLDPDGTFVATQTMINGVNHCGSRESWLPGGIMPPTCITATAPLCTGDPPVIAAVLAAGGVTGLTIPALPATSTVTCDNPAWPFGVGSTYDLQLAVASKLSGGAYTWPRWTPPAPTAAQVDVDMCLPLQNVLLAVQGELSQCLLAPNAFFDMTFLSGPWCDAPAIAAGNVCSSSPFTPTCVCNPTAGGCGGGVAPQACSINLDYRARQQVAICELYNPAAGRVGSYYNSQPDNVLQPGGCRENVGMLFTDGTYAFEGGVALQANNARTVYNSPTGQSNLYVFKTSGYSSFIPHSNRLQYEFSKIPGPAVPAYDATDLSSMQSSFAQVLSRTYKGVYSGSSMGINDLGDRVALSSFTVPGYSSNPSVPSDDYIGWPLRIALHAVDATGNVGAKIFETDHLTKAGPASLCYNEINTSGADVAEIGPDGNFGNGSARTRNISLIHDIDRDGDGALDPHPTLRWGRMFGFSSDRPVMVEAPSEQVGKQNAAAFIAFRNGMLPGPISRPLNERPRAIYFQAGGHVMGLHGGNYNNAAPTAFGYTRRPYYYEDTAIDAGREIMRYRPPWLQNDTDNDYTYSSNKLIQQPMLTGQMIAREVYVRDGADRFRTLLIGNAGKSGRGFYTLDVSDPCNPRELATWEFTAALDRASAEPTLYTMRMSGGLTYRPVVMTTSGYKNDTTPRIMAYDAVTGVLLASRALPNTAGRYYPTAPACVDATGEQSETHCYVVASDGLLVRIPVVVDGFGAPFDMTPPVPGVRNPTVGGKTYSTPPVTFFDANQQVNIVYGSGDAANLTAPDVQNYVYRFVDTTTRKLGVPDLAAQFSQVCAPSAGDDTGIITLPPNHRLVSAPVVSNSGVFFSTYQSVSNGCSSGNAFIAGMDTKTCADVLNPGPRPVPVAAGSGLATSPVLHRVSGRVLSKPSGAPTAGQVTDQAASLKGGLFQAIRKLFWRSVRDLR